MNKSANLILMTAVFMITYCQSGFAESRLDDFRKFVTEPPPRINHQTQFGDVWACDPQVPFNAKAWASDPTGESGELMLVDLIENKLLLGKQQFEIEELFHSKGLKEASGDTRYEFYRGMVRCGNAVPTQGMEIRYSADKKVLEYRSFFQGECGQPPALRSDWVK